MTETIIKMLHIIKTIPSHMVIITEGSFGVRTMIRIASSLASISFNEIEFDNLNNIISDCINIIKVGGRIDQSCYYMAPKTLDKIGEH